MFFLPGFLGTDVFGVVLGEASLFLLLECDLLILCSDIFLMDRVSSCLSLMTSCNFFNLFSVFLTHFSISTIFFSTILFINWSSISYIRSLYSWLKFFIFFCNLFKVIESSYFSSNSSSNILILSLYFLTWASNWYGFWNCWSIGLKGTGCW